MTATQEVFPNGLAPFIEAAEAAAQAAVSFQARSAKIREEVIEKIARARQRFSMTRADTLAQYDTLVSSVAKAYELPQELTRFAVLPTKEKHVAAVQQRLEPDMPPLPVAHSSAGQSRGGR